MNINKLNKMSEATCGGHCKVGFPNIDCIKIGAYKQSACAKYCINKLGSEIIKVEKLVSLITLKIGRKNET